MSFEYSAPGSFYEVPGQLSRAFGQYYILLQMPVKKFVDQSTVKNNPEDGDVTQRKLDKKHSDRLAKFFFQALMEDTHSRWDEEKNGPLDSDIEEILAHLNTQPFYGTQPFVAVLPGDFFNDYKVQQKYENVENRLRISLRAHQRLNIIDGQHRREALVTVSNLLNQIIDDKKYTNSRGLVPTGAQGLKKVSSGSLSFFSLARELFFEEYAVAVQVYVNMSPDQERQLFHDLNALGKKMNITLALSFDKGNPVNQFSTRLCSMDWFTGEVVNTDNKKVEFDSPEYLSLRNLNYINALLFLNKTSINGATPTKVKPNEKSALLLWKEIVKISDYSDRSKCIAAQTCMLKSITKLYYRHAFSRNAEDENQKKILDGLASIDFSIDNDFWNLTAWDEAYLKANHPKLLSDYLPDNWKDKPTGLIVDGKFRFTSRHNDAMTILIPILQYLLGIE